jgi:predicted MPP superfamily phosphohydrolase
VGFLLPPRSPIVRVAAVGALAAGAALGYARVESTMFRLRSVRVALLPAGSRPLRVLHLSDMHLTPADRRRVAWVRGLATLKPHLVVDTGDNLAHPDAVPTALEALEPLLGLPGLFVLGSNDYFGPKPVNPLRYFAGPSRLHAGRATLPTDDLVAGLTGAGWTDLNNRRAELDVGGVRLRMVGVDDPHIDLDRYPPGSMASDLRVGDGDGRGGDLRLGVLHAPYRRVLDPMAAECDLVLAGHTHGGQVCVPFLPTGRALVTNCDLPSRYARGLNRWTVGDEQAWLHVSAGVGTSPYARIRFACPPEATLLTLEPR